MEGGTGLDEHCERLVERCDWWNNFAGQSGLRASVSSCVTERAGETTNLKRNFSEF